MDEALDRAVRVFRERGYHATSIGDLAEAMNLASGSIYKAFKDKHAVFLAAFDRYAARRTAETRGAAATGASGRARLRNVLLSYVGASQGIEGRRGCLVIGSTIELAALDPEVATRVTESLKANEAFLTDLIHQGHTDGSIPAHIDAGTTARTLICLTQGLRVVGKARARLDGDALVDTAMKMLA
jgi:AcrR family transcriptional regulator